ncbi:MAG TPA: deoxyribonuclease IV [Vicinamibacterales bacterium]|nr:deoxyribonuclease IV [Vicinamibacterales bacterium]
MPRLGAHLSIGGGLPRAVDRALVSRCDTLQIFTKSAGQWRARPLPDREIEEFRARVRTSGIAPVFAHDSYLINVAAANPLLRRQSIAALWEEIERAEALGLDGLVMHPGSYTTGTESDGLKLIAEALGELLSRRRLKTTILLEHTAGQGTNLGHRFEHLAAILDGLKWTKKVGVCLDTCHLVAAGYDITHERGYRQTFRQLDAAVGLDRVRAFHLNDSKKPCGSRVDRHEHIGKGCLGLETFRRLLNDRRFAALPMLLETPKDVVAERTRSATALTVDRYDAMNLATLRGLMKRGQTPFHSPNTCA